MGMIIIITRKVTPRAIISIREKILEIITQIRSIIRFEQDKTVINLLIGLKKDRVVIIMLIEENMVTTKTATMASSNMNNHMKIKLIMQITIKKFQLNMLMILIYIMLFKHHFRMFSRKQLKIPVTKMRIWMLNNKEIIVLKIQEMLIKEAKEDIRMMLLKK